MYDSTSAVCRGRSLVRLRREFVGDWDIVGGSGVRGRWGLGFVWSRRGPLALGGVLGGLGLDGAVGKALVMGLSETDDAEGLLACQLGSDHLLSGLSLPQCRNCAHQDLQVDLSIAH